MSDRALSKADGGERASDRDRAGGGTRPPTQAAVDDDSPGVPGLRSWRAVYALVLAVFVLVVIALAVFTRAYA